MIRRVAKSKREGVLRSTLNWFNDFFGTGLEELDMGETGKPASCVIAMTLNNKINPNFNWRVNGSDITISTDQPFNSTGKGVRNTFNEEHQQWGVHVTIGEGDVYDIVTRVAHPIESGTDYLTAVCEKQITELPDDVKQFILWFDAGQYQELTIHNDEEENCACASCLIERGEIEHADELK